MTDRENRWYIVRDMGLVCNHDLLNQNESTISIVNASKEEVGLVLRFLNAKTDEIEKENIACEIEKLLKECGKLKEHDWIDYIFLNEL